MKVIKSRSNNRDGSQRLSSQNRSICGEERKASRIIIVDYPCRDRRVHTPSTCGVGKDDQITTSALPRVDQR